MVDVLSLLPPFEWRGKKYPITTRSVSFAHAKAKHHIQYRDGIPVEPTGPENLVLSYTLPMREGIAKGPYADLFTGGLPQLLKDCRDRTPGILLDPVYGEFTCTPNTFNDDTDPKLRDGTEIRVEFEHSPELDDADPATTGVSLGGISDDAGALDESLTAVDWEQVPAPEGMTDILSAIAGFGSQIDRAQNKVAARLEDLAFRAEKVEAAADKLENPKVWPVRRAARRVRADALRLKERADDPQSRLRTVTTRFQTTISVEAAATGLTVAQLLKLNPGLAKLPFIPAGTPIRAPAR